MNLFDMPDKVFLHEIASSPFALAIQLSARERCDTMHT
jgi:hypothetical protein